MLAAGAAALAVLIAAATVAAGAADDPESVIKQRREFMKGNGGHMKAIYDALQAGTDLSGIPAEAKAIRDNAEKIPTLFPEGTGMDKFPGKTGAKPEIWAEWDKFTAAAKNLQSEADKFLLVAQSGDKDAIAQAFDAFGKNGCGGCHQTFRQKLDQ
ncbi:MAG: cytochrome c [Rhodospirillaceae bacterium]|nr:cytochrome c [Rhodospirillaceae bacterium]